VAVDGAALPSTSSGNQLFGVRIPSSHGGCKWRAGDGSHCYVDHSERHLQKCIALHGISNIAV
jgi:hypothetical protein